MNMQGAKPHTAEVWTVFVRISHWLVAFFLVINFFNESGYWHRLIGYFCLVVVIARISYGLWLTKVASSKFYIPTIQHIKQHIHEISTRIFAPHNGHNPLGQLAVYFIWMLIILLAFTGWLSRTDAYWGEDWPVDLHLIFSNVLQGFVIFHIVAVVLMSKLQKKNLLTQMVNGQSSSTNC